MHRRLFNFAAVMSMLLCLGTVALWARSYTTPEVLILTSKGSKQLINNHGYFRFFGMFGPPFTSGPEGLRLVKAESLSLNLLV